MMKDADITTNGIGDQRVFAARAQYERYRNGKLLETIMGRLLNFRSAGSYAEAKTQALSELASIAALCVPK